MIPKYQDMSRIIRQRILHYSAATLPGSLSLYPCYVKHSWLGSIPRLLRGRERTPING